MISTKDISHFNDDIRAWVVWLLRIVIGSVFIFSGLTKIVDPWGFILKINEYLNIWGIHWLWREVVTCIAVTLSSIEFLVGVLLLTGCMRKTVCRVMAFLMIFMLPLSAYIAIATPVDDCGCFGDALLISNDVTFWKNVAITIAVIYLLFNNHKIKCLYPPLIQWMVIVITITYCLVLAVVGMSVQPVLDFRPFKVGTKLVENQDESIYLLYEKEGVVSEFDVDNLPDSTWTYMGRKIKKTSVKKDFAIFDGDEDVTNDVIASEGKQTILVVSNPEYHQKARAGMANSINDYITMLGGSMFAVVAVSPDSLEIWVEKTHPNFEVYTSDDTVLKEIARGDAALIYLEDGIIRWKRNIYSLPGDFPDFEADHNELEEVMVVDSGNTMFQLTGIYVSLLVLIFVIGLIRVRKNN